MNILIILILSMIVTLEGIVLIYDIREKGLFPEKEQKKDDR